MALGTLSPVLLEESLRTWWKRFEVPVFYEEDGSVSVGRGDAAAEAWRQFEQQQKMQVFRAWDLASEDRTGMLVGVRRRQPDDVLIPLKHPPRDTGELRSGPPDIRIFRTFRIPDPPPPRIDPTLAFLLDESFDDPPARRIPPDGVPCRHPGCLSHISHPCEGCGRIGGRSAP